MTLHMTELYLQACSQHQTLYQISPYSDDQWCLPKILLSWADHLTLRRRCNLSITSCEGSKGRMGSWMLPLCCLHSVLAWTECASRELRVHAFPSGAGVLCTHMYLCTFVVHVGGVQCMCFLCHLVVSSKHDVKMDEVCSNHKCGVWNDLSHLLPHWCKGVFQMWVALPTLDCCIRVVSYVQETILSNQQPCQWTLKMWKYLLQKAHHWPGQEVSTLGRCRTLMMKILLHFLTV